MARQDGVPKIVIAKFFNLSIGGTGKAEAEAEVVAVK